jgi:hypothetical protein
MTLPRRSFLLGREATSGGERMRGSKQKGRHEREAWEVGEGGGGVREAAVGAVRGAEGGDNG